MEHAEARRLLAAELGTYRQRSYSDLIAMIEDENHPAFDVIGRDGHHYWLEVQAFWDDDDTNVVRVRGAICGGGIDYQVPICADFLRAADGSFVDE
ncbi:MAG: hypothetical protein ACRENH_07970 [Gemmatimonadaceae bacterium]